MENEFLISFIIPAHNAVKTLANCVSSITNCDNDNYEVLIIENGSNDGTYQLAMSLTKNQTNVKVFQSEKGVAKARNLGIEKASGKWIFFVDADDRLTANGIRTVFFDAAVNSCDLIIYSHVSGNEKRLVTNVTKSFQNDEVENARITMLESPTRYMTVWGKLFRHSIIDDYNVVFNTSLSFSEDSHFVLNYTKYCNEIMFSKELVYNYTLNGNSAVRTLNSQKIDAYIIALYETEKLLADENTAIKTAFNSFVLVHLDLIGVHEIFSVDNKVSYRKKLEIFRLICDNLLFRNALQSLKIADCRSFAMLPPLFSKLHFYAMSGLIMSFRSFQNKRKEENY